MYPLKYEINLYFSKRNTMEFLEMYKATELAERLGVHRKRIPADKRLYIPIRIKTAITKNSTPPTAADTTMLALKTSRMTTASAAENTSANSRRWTREPKNPRGRLRANPHDLQHHQR